MDDQDRREALTRFEIRTETDEEEVSQVIHEEAARRVRTGITTPPPRDEPHKSPSVSPIARGVVLVLHALPMGGRVVVLCVALIVLALVFGHEQIARAFRK